jgi:hypothetical protein
MNIRTSWLIICFNQSYVIVEMKSNLFLSQYLPDHVIVTKSVTNSLQAGRQASTGNL